MQKFGIPATCYSHIWTTTEDVKRTKNQISCNQYTIIMHWSGVEGFQKSPIRGRLCEKHSNSGWERVELHTMNVWIRIGSRGAHILNFGMSCVSFTLFRRYSEWKVPQYLWDKCRWWGPRDGLNMVAGGKNACHNQKANFSHYIPPSVVFWVADLWA